MGNQNQKREGTKKKRKDKKKKNVPGHFRSDLIGAGSVMCEYDFRKKYLTFQNKPSIMAVCIFERKL